MSKKSPQGFEQITKAREIPFKDVHPSVSKGGRFKGRDLPPYSGSDGQESLFTKCKQCGFIVNKRRDQSGSGWGNDTVESITTIAGGTANAKDPVSAAGCPLCSSSEFE
jgi:hypothetical protein